MNEIKVRQLPGFVQECINDLIDHEHNLKNQKTPETIAHVVREICDTVYVAVMEASHEIPEPDNYTEDPITPDDISSFIDTMNHRYHEFSDCLDKLYRTTSFNRNTGQIMTALTNSDSITSQVKQRCLTLLHEVIQDLYNYGKSSANESTMISLKDLL